MDTINLVISAIGTLGFPIVACCALFMQTNRLSENHKEETKQLADAINNNTLALTKLMERMGNED